MKGFDFAMKNEINIGICGFGFMGRTHSFAVSSLPFFYSDVDSPLPFTARVKGVLNRSLEKSELVSREFSFEKAYSSFEEMLNDDSIDVIDICTPNIYHFDMIRAAISAGKHVYCEKPLCESYDKAKTAAELARNSASICSIVFNNRHLAAIKRAKQIIDSGAIGKIISFNFEYLHDSCTFPGKVPGWKQDAKICGDGGVLFDLGSHIIDLAVMLCGKISNVSARSQIAFPTHPTKDGGQWITNAGEAFYVIAETENGATGTLTASKIAKGTSDGLNFEVYGTNGSLRFSLMEPGRLQYFDGSAPGEPIGGSSGFTTIECGGRSPAPAGIFPSPKAPVGWLMGHIASMYNFLECVNSEKKCNPSFDDGAYVSAVMDSIMRSCRTGTNVKVTE